MTASCMELSRVSSWRWLVCTARKLSSNLRAVLSSAVATLPISSTEVAEMRGSQVSGRDAPGKMHDALQPTGGVVGPDGGQQHHKHERNKRAEQQRAMNALGCRFHVG